MFTETQRKRRGHMFYPTRAIARRIPALRATDGNGSPVDRVAWVHYFVASCDWYVIELDPETGEAFGWADLGAGGEFGYFSLPELERTCVKPQGYPFGLVVERDMFFAPGPLRDRARLTRR